MASRTPLYNDFYLRGNLSDQQIKWLLKVHGDQAAPKLKHVIDGFELHDPQTVAVAMGILNPRFFIADKVGLGKGLMAAAIYARLKQMNAIKVQNGEAAPIGKQLIVTVPHNVIQMANTYRRYGQNIVPIHGGNAKKVLNDFDINDPNIDGIVIPWSGMISQGILAYISNNLDKFSFGVYDETEKLVKEGSQTYTNANAIAKNLNRMIFTYGTPWQKSVMDFFFQFKVLNPTVLPYKNFLQQNYAVMDEEYYWSFDRNLRQSTKRTRYVVGDYKNQQELKERLALHFLSRSKKDYANSLPEHVITAVPVEMSIHQKEQINEYTQKAVFLNSPTTCNEDAFFTKRHVSKLEKVLDLCEEIKEDRPIIYCHHPKAQVVIYEHLKEMGWKVAYINGKTEYEMRSEIIDDFNDYKLDCIILNVYDAVNLPTSQAVIFYTIPTKPNITYQVMGRIDRNNYTQVKSYYFLIYMDSIEVQRLRELSLFREYHANEFTGSADSVYHQLDSQISAIEDQRREYSEEPDFDFDEVMGL